MGNLLVCGGGIGGMSLAIRLREAGWAVDLVELDPEWRVYGAGISITAPTFRAFKTLGLLDELKTRGFCSEFDVRICAPSGETVAEVPTPAIEPGLPVQGGIMRPALHSILSSRTRARGVDVRLGVTIASLEESGERVAVTTTDGLSRSYDAVVAADGVNSRMRTLLFPGAPRPRYTGQYCWRLVAERPAAIDRCHFYVAGPITAGLMPTSARQMYMFLLQPEPAKMHLDETTQWRRLRDLMMPFSGPLGELRDGLCPDSIINCRPLEAVLLPKPWHIGRVGLLGDATHATTPHLASGAGIAVEDALLLSDYLIEETDVERALTRWENRRFERCRMVVENSVAIGQMQIGHASPDKLKSLMGKSEELLRAEP
jgi:2-polyprenyl-6-methoxyphenol hydroxylase-like FAD-dependent oxidoreductase